MAPSNKALHVCLQQAFKMGQTMGMWDGRNKTCFVPPARLQMIEKRESK